MSDNTMSADDLLRAALTRVEAEAAKGGDKSLWDQKLWTTETECGTAHCLGGWAAVIDGHTLESDDEGWVSIKDSQWYVPDWLNDRFGDRAQPLWDSSNSLDDLRAGVEAYLAGADLRHVGMAVYRMKTP